MIEGVVNAAREAIVTLPLRGPLGQAQEVEAVIDTGYDGYLSLPPAMVAELGLPFRYQGRAVLAKGSEEAFNVYGVTVMWDDQPRFVEADAVGMEPLVGMLALDSHSLYAEVVDGGRVVIQMME